MTVAPFSGQEQRRRHDSGVGEHGGRVSETGIV